MNILCFQMPLTPIRHITHYDVFSISLFHVSTPFVLLLWVQIWSIELMGRDSMSFI